MARQSITVKDFVPNSIKPLIPCLIEYVGMGLVCVQCAVVFKSDVFNQDTIRLDGCTVVLRGCHADWTWHGVCLDSCVNALGLAERRAWEQTPW